MNTHRCHPARRPLAALTIAAALAALAGCGSDPESEAGAEPSASTAESSTTAASSPAESDLPTEPPSTAAEVPDGVYRTRVTKEALTEAGAYEMSNAGTWTLTLDQGSYRLSCAWVDQDGDDCGHSEVADRDIVLEAGQALGDATTLWLDYDKATTDELNGMDYNPPDGAFPPYRLTWEQDGTDLVLRDVWVPATVGSPEDVNNYTLQPWTKID